VLLGLSGVGLHALDVVNGTDLLGETGNLIDF
jgi:hypothetical protein